MELKRVPVASTFIVFPLVDDTGKGVASLTSGTASWIAWGDATKPNRWSLQPCAFRNEVYQILNPARSLFSLQLATTELPAASPYVMVVIEGSNVATQYVLINTATTYATLATITHTGAAVPLQMDQAVNSSTANTTGHVLGKMSYATHYLGGGASVYATLTTLTHTGAAVPIQMGQSVDASTANTTGHVLGKISYATHYLGGGASIYATLTTTTHTGAVVPSVTSVGTVTGNVNGSVGSVTGNVDGSVGSVTGAVGSVAGNVDGSTASVTSAVTVDQTAVISSGTANSIGEALRFVHHASNYLGDRNVGGASIYATLRTITHTGAVVPTTVTVDASGYITITTTAETHLIRMIWNETVAAFTGFPTKTREFLYWVRQAFKNKLDYDKGTDTMVLYEDDGTTPKSSHTMTDDASNATRGAGA